MPTSTRTLSPQQLRKLRANLAASKKQAAPNRLLSVLADETIRRGISDSHLREVLLHAVDDVVLREVIGGDVSWLVSLRKADSLVMMLKSAAGRRTFMKNGAASGIARLAAPENVSVVESLGGQARGISEPMARWITAVVVVDILRSNGDGMRGSVISNAKLAAELGVHKDAVGKALKWAEANSILRPVRKWKGGGTRWVIVGMTDDQRTVVMTRFGDVVTSLAGALILDIGDADTAVESDEVDERVLARQARQKVNQVERLRETVTSTNPFANLFISSWEPVGIMKGLDPFTAPVIAADILRSANSVLWNSGKHGGLTPKVWLSMFAGAMGIDAGVLGLEAEFTSGRANRAFGKGWMKRLNAGESFVDLVFLAESDGALDWRTERVEGWAAQSAAFKQRRAEWGAQKDAAEEKLNELMRATGGMPKKSVAAGERNDWLRRAQAAGMKLDLNGTSAEAVNKQLKRRFQLKGYSDDKARAAASHIIPMAAGEVVI